MSFQSMRKSHQEILLLFRVNQSQREIYMVIVLCLQNSYMLIVNINIY